jgi:hypothetical protein
MKYIRCVFLKARDATLYTFRNKTTKMVQDTLNVYEVMKMYWGQNSILFIVSHFQCKTLLRMEGK